MNKPDAWLDGWFAHKSGTSPDNPYDEQSQERSHHQWDAGWWARFSAVKYGLELTYDEQLLRISS